MNSTKLLTQNLNKLTPMIGEIALDSNIAIGYLKGNATIIEKLKIYSTFILPVPVVGELLFGASNSARVLTNLTYYRQFIAQCDVVPITAQTAAYYAQIRLKLKQKGRPIPENDIWIAAQCFEHRWVLATYDHHFTFIEDLRFEMFD